jgi:hypothetical protein
MSSAEFSWLSLNILGPSIVAALLVSGILYAVRAFVIEPRAARRHRAAVLGFSVRDSDFAPTIIVGAIDSVATGIYMRPTVGYGSLLAVAYVSQVVGDVSPVSSRVNDLEVFLAGDQVATKSLSKDNEHNILIGGPQRNCETLGIISDLNRRIAAGETLLVPSKLALPAQSARRVQTAGEAISFLDDLEGKVRSLNVDGYEYVAKITPEAGASAGNRFRNGAGIGSVEGTDYGLIIRTKAPKDAGRLVILAGVHTFGSAGASRFLTELAQVRGPWDRFFRGRRSSEDHYVTALKYLRRKAHQDVVLVICSEVKHGMLTSARAVAAWNIEDCGVRESQ